jgi:hypothetical protein
MTMDVTLGNLPVQVGFEVTGTLSAAPVISSAVATPGLQATVIGRAGGTGAGAGAGAGTTVLVLEGPIGID